MKQDIDDRNVTEHRLHWWRPRREMKEVLKSYKAFLLFLVGDRGIEPEEEKFSGRPCSNVMWCFSPITRSQSQWRWRVENSTANSCAWFRAWSTYSMALYYFLANLILFITALKVFFFARSTWYFLSDQLVLYIWNNIALKSHKCSFVHAWPSKQNKNDIFSKTVDSCRFYFLYIKCPSIAIENLKKM